MIADIDKDGSGTIDFDEFLQVRGSMDALTAGLVSACRCAAKRLHVCAALVPTGIGTSPTPPEQMMTAKMGERDSREEIMKAFRLFDDDETGKISFKNLKRVAKELGENITDEELQEVRGREGRTTWEGGSTALLTASSHCCCSNWPADDRRGRPRWRWRGERGGVLPHHEGVALSWTCLRRHKTS